MRITNIRIKREGNNISLVADCKIRVIGYDTVYFTFDKKYESSIVADASPFAAALLVPAMRRGENLTIDGSVSRRFLEGMQSIMKIMLTWNLGLKPIKIQAKNLTVDQGDQKNVAVFFSGGVDSFYTYLKHKSSRKNKITHFLLVNGYDIDLRDKNFWEVARQNIQRIAAEENIELIEVESNIRPLIEPIMDWGYVFGGCLAAVGLCLRAGLRKIYIASSCTVEQQFPSGSSLATDACWSTETTSFEHDGTEASRVEKVAYIAQTPVALNYLRVCYKNVHGFYNCGVCDKCVRTMIGLHIAGKLEDTATLPHVIDPQKVATITIENEHTAMFHKENLMALKEKGLNIPLQTAIERSLNHAVVSPGEDWFVQLWDGVFHVDFMYFHNTLQRMIHFLRKSLFIRQPNELKPKKIPQWE